MPNHCYNRVTFYCDDTTAILKLHKIFNGDTDTQTVFENFIPEPNWAEIPLTENTLKEHGFSSPRGEVGELPELIDHEIMGKCLRFKSTDAQDDRWYNWRVQNWGTKWDAYDLSIEEDDMPYGFQVTFNTAWSPPEEICHAIRDQFDDLSVSWFYDEPGCEVAGYL